MKNWKTTVAGVVAGVVYAWANSAENDPKKLLVSLALVAFGILCKDFNHPDGQ
jgi:hypothetical protein